MTMLGPRPDFIKIKPGGSISARDFNALADRVSQIAAMLNREGVSGSEGILYRGKHVRPVKLVWGYIVERDGPAAPPYPAGPTGTADLFRYIGETIDGGYRTTMERPALVTYNGLPEVIAAPLVGELGPDKREALCIIALDAPDADGQPSIQLMACRERLNFDLCPSGGGSGGDTLLNAIRAMIAAELGSVVATLPPPPGNELGIASLLDGISGVSQTVNIYGTTSLGDPTPVEHTVVIERGLITSWTTT